MKTFLIAAVIGAAATMAQAASLAPRTSLVPPPWIIYTQQQSCYVAVHHAQPAQIAGDCR